MWRCALCQFHSGDAEGPDVGPEVITSLLDDLGGHPEGCTDKGHALRFDICELCGDTEVGEFDLALVCEEHVGGLYVAMDLAGGV